MCGTRMPNRSHSINNISQLQEIQKSHLEKGTAIMSACCVIFNLLLLLLLLFSVISSSDATSRSNVSATNSEMKPLMEPVKVVEMKLMMRNESRRRLSSFQICALCTCCGGAKGLCLPSPCCYAINCNIPNRPFGFCSFTPKTYNCFGCRL